MIHPVRAVCRAAARAHAALYCARHLDRCKWPHGPRVKLGWGRLSGAEGMQGGPGRLQKFPLTWERSTPPPPRSLLCSADVPDRLKWQPWPVEPPLIDRVRTRWPSDHWPPAEPPVAIEDRLPDVPPQILLWRNSGNLLDMWA